MDCQDSEGCYHGSGALSVPGNYGHISIFKDKAAGHHKSGAVSVLGTYGQIRIVDYQEVEN